MGIEDDIELARKMAAPRIEKAVRLRDSARSQLGGEQTGNVEIADDEGVKYEVKFGKIDVLNPHEDTPEVLVFEADDMANTVVAFFANGCVETRVPEPCKMDIVKLRLDDGSFMDGRDRRNGRVITCDAFGSAGLTPANDRRCSLCGATVASGRKLLRCARCVDKGLEPNRYCSKACQRKAWPSHKKWHESVEKMKSQTDGVEDDSWAQFRAASASGRAKMAAATGLTVEHLELGCRASELSALGNYAKAVKVYKKMIALDPGQFDGHFGLGIELAKSGHCELAIASLDKAMDCSRVGSFQWADAFLAAVPLIMSSAAEVDTLPKWWVDDRLKVMSKLAIGGAREDRTLIGTAWRIRGHVLSGFVAQRGATDHNIVAETGHKLWLNGHRTPAELEEAAAAYEKAHRACQIARRTLFHELERAETCRGWAASVRGTDPERRARFKGLTTEQAFDIAKQVLERKVMNGKTAGENGF